MVSFNSFLKRKSWIFFNSSLPGADSPDLYFINHDVYNWVIDREFFFAVAGIRFKKFTLLHIVFPLGTRIGRHIWYIASAVHGDISQPRSEHFCFEKITSLTTISATPSKMSNECEKDWICVLRVSWKSFTARFLVWIIGWTTTTTTTNQLNLIALCLLLKLLAYFFSYSMKTVLLPLHGESESTRDQ